MKNSRVLGVAAGLLWSLGCGESKDDGSPNEGESVCGAGQTACAGTCVSPAVDPLNCGVCGNDCPAGATCAEGECVCQNGLSICGELCTDLTRDEGNCGSCGTRCPAGSACQAGTCQCDGGLLACGTSCVNPAADATNCGSCGRACAADQVCFEGECSTGCGGGLEQCGQDCVDLAADPLACGTCATVCASGLACIAGVCSCPAGQTACGAVCVDLASDAGNCGLCANACTGGRACLDGVCACPTGQDFCTDHCVDLAADSAHCGACGRACATGSSCVEGSCAGGTGGVGGSGGLPTGGNRSGGNGGTGGSGVGGVGGGNGGGSTGGVATGGASTGGRSGTGGTDGPCRETDCGTHKWACWPMPNPASSPASVPNHQTYADLGNGAVRDDLTCLVWEKENPASVGNWQANHDRCAELAASGYAGFDDWRLPTRIEMASISDVTLGRTGYPTVFGVTSGYYVTGSFWYKTIITTTEDRVWGYGTNGFTSNAIVRSETGHVARCVRGNGPGEAADELAVEPPDHYTIGADTVTDNYTGLTWQRGRSPSLMAWEDAAGYCEGLTLDGFTGWRVPTLNELASTVNEAKVGGAIVESAFPDNPNGCREPQYWFWAAEASAVGGTAWGLSYCDGFTGYNVGTSGAWNYFPTANARCVR
ncbi:MAG: DUF1566 domain-containing protein [Polyangiaceae bacterium]|nr:DUF1566 domain-containing protein [Polyangiaceae bacterium]